MAVIASLLYVGLQIRQNTRVMRGQAMAGLLFGQSSAETMIMGTDTAAAFVKACESPAELTSEEITKLWAYLNVATMAGQHMYEMHSLGLVTAEDRRSAISSVANWLSFPFGEIWWKAYRTSDVLPSGFVAAIDAGLTVEPRSLQRQFEEMKEGVKALAAI